MLLYTNNAGNFNYVNDQQKLKTVVVVHRGWKFNIYIITSPKNELLFTGFTKMCQQLLPRKTNQFYVIPSSISTLCQQYFGHYWTEYHAAGFNGRYPCGIPGTLAETSYFFLQDHTNE